MERKHKVIEYKNLDSAINSVSGTKVLVGGCFDVLHIGHIRFLQSAKKQGENLIVALESDEYIKVKKNRQPFHTQIERAEILASMQCIDYIILLPYFTTSSEYHMLVTQVMPTIIAVTENDSQKYNKELQAKAINANVVTVTPYIPQKASSTLLGVLQKDL